MEKRISPLSSRIKTERWSTSWNHSTNFTVRKICAVNSLLRDCAASIDIYYYYYYYYYIIILTLGTYDPEGFKNYWKKYDNRYEQSIGAVISSIIIYYYYYYYTPTLMDVLHEHVSCSRILTRLSDVQIKKLGKDNRVFCDSSNNCCISNTSR